MADSQLFLYNLLLALLLVYGGVIAANYHDMIILDSSVKGYCETHSSLKCRVVDYTPLGISLEFRERVNDYITHLNVTLPHYDCQTSFSKRINWDEWGKMHVSCTRPLHLEDIIGNEYEFSIKYYAFPLRKTLKGDGILAFKPQGIERLKFDIIQKTGIFEYTHIRAGIYLGACVFIIFLIRKRKRTLELSSIHKKDLETEEQFNIKQLKLTKR